MRSPASARRLLAITAKATFITPTATSEISVLVPGCNQRSEAVAVLDNPPLVAMKNLAWDTVEKTIMPEAPAAPKN